MNRQFKINVEWTFFNQYRNMIALQDDTHYFTYLQAPVRVISCTSCLYSININIRANYFVKNHHKRILCKYIIIGDIFSQFNLLAIKEMIITSVQKWSGTCSLVENTVYMYIVSIWTDYCPEYNTRARRIDNVPCNVAIGCPNFTFLSNEVYQCKININFYTYQSLWYRYTKRNIKVFIFMLTTICNDW